MLYSIGTLQLDTTPFSIDTIERQASADFATKAVIGAPPRREFMGEGDERITLAGQLLPSAIGGLTELETAHSFRRAGTRLPVMRGDGKALGWFVVTSISENHSALGADGIGFEVAHEIALVKVEPPSGAEGGALIGGLLSLFGLLR